VSKKGVFGLAIYVIPSIILLALALIFFSFIFFTDFTQPKNIVVESFKDDTLLLNLLRTPIEVNGEKINIADFIARKELRSEDEFKQDWNLIKQKADLVFEHCYPSGGGTIAWKLLIYNMDEDINLPALEEYKYYHVLNCYCDTNIDKIQSVNVPLVSSNKFVKVVLVECLRGRKAAC